MFFVFRCFCVLPFAVIYDNDNDDDAWLMCAFWRICRQTSWPQPPRTLEYTATCQIQRELHLLQFYIIFIHTKPLYTVTKRHVSWTQNVTEIPLVWGLLWRTPHKCVNPQLDVWVSCHFEVDLVVYRCSLWRLACS